MDDKRLKYRISESELSNEFKRDGETLYGADLNRIVTVTKGGINYNAELFESYLYGDEYRPFYHGNEVDWQTKDEYIDYGIVYWVRSTLDVLTGLPYVYVTKMEYNGTSESWVEKEIIKFIDTESLNKVLEDYLKKSGGYMHGNIDMGSHDITNVDYLSTHRVRADKNITKEIALLSSAGQEEANIKIDENGNIDFNGKTVVNIELPEVEAKLDVKLDGKLDKLTGRGETGLRVYAAFNGGVETSLDVDVNPSSFTLARRGENGEVWTGDATKKHDAVPLGQLNTLLETKVDKVKGKQLSDENFTSAEKSKLAGLESSRFIGQFVSLQALNTAHPTAPIGSYAYVDEGSGKDTVKYVWDSSDSTWVLGTPSTAELTPAMVKQLYEENDDTNAYTDAEKGKVALIDSKLDKVSTTSPHSRAYVINEDGTQGHIAASYATLANTIARRSHWGNLEVGEAKTSNDAVPRGQADGRYASKVELNGKQDKLVSGTNIKTVGGQSLLGSGNIPFPSTAEFASKAELAPYISSKNLGFPDLTGKEYLGDGWYRQYNLNGITLDFNVFNGFYRMNGTSTSIVNRIMVRFYMIGTYTLSHLYVSGSLTGLQSFRYDLSAVSGILGIGQNNYQENHYETFTNESSNVAMYYTLGQTYDNYTFKLQIEKGTEATPYALPAGVIPYIPEVKTHFDSKLDKVSTTDLYHRAYTTAPNGEQNNVRLVTGKMPLTVPLRNAQGLFEVENATGTNHPIPMGQADSRYAFKSDNGNVLTNPATTANEAVPLGQADSRYALKEDVPNADDFATKQDLDDKLDKKTGISLSTLFYVKMPDGSQGMMVLDKDDENKAGSVPFRNNSRTFRVGDAVYEDNPVTLGQADDRYASKSVEETKQDKLVAGENITIDPVTNVISSRGGSSSTKPIYQSIVNTIDHSGTHYLFNGIDTLMNPNGLTEFDQSDTTYRRVKEVTFILKEEETEDMENPSTQLFAGFKRVQSITIPLSIQYYGAGMEQIDISLFYPIVFKKLDGTYVTIRVTPLSGNMLSGPDDSAFGSLQVEVTNVNGWSEELPAGSPMQILEVAIKYESRY